MNNLVVVDVKGKIGFDTVMIPRIGWRPLTIIRHQTRVEMNTIPEYADNLTRYGIRGSLDKPCVLARRRERIVC